MSDLRIRVVGAEEAARSFELAARRFRPALVSAVAKSGLLVERNAKLAMRGNRTRARRKGRRVTSPRHVLGIDTGRLRQSITTDVFTRGKRLFAEIGPQRVIYARIHEVGGRTGKQHRARIPARPYMAPALKKSMRGIERFLTRALRVV